MAGDREGRTAVVLGGTQGIGREVVTSLASRGATVYLSGRTMESATSASESAIVSGRARSTASGLVP